MKKTYVKPETLVVAINVETLIALSPINEEATSGDPNGDGNSREVLISDETTIIARGAWETWE